MPDKDLRKKFLDLYPVSWEGYYEQCNEVS